MSEPTQDQVRRLWERVGWKRIEPGRGGYHYVRGVKEWNWIAPDRTERFHSQSHLPRVSLDNLIEYVVPVLARWEMGSTEDGSKKPPPTLCRRGQWQDYGISSLVLSA